MPYVKHFPITRMPLSVSLLPSIHLFSTAYAGWGAEAYTNQIQLPRQRRMEQTVQRL